MTDANQRSAIPESRLKRSYDEQFKRDAVALLEGGRTAGTVTLGGAVTVGSMAFNAGTGNYTIAGGGNTLDTAH